MAQYVYTMSHVSKVVPPRREILKDINLSFFPGAKIGVLGINGSGKSTLMRIMAGMDSDIQGEARPMPDLNIGYLAQEPHLNDDDDVRTAVESGLGTVKAALDEFNAISDKFAEPMEDDEMNELLARQGELQSVIDAADGWELDRILDIAADALRLPPWDATIGNLSGGEKRRVALCRLLLSKPDMLLLDEPTNHLDAESVGWLERFLHDYAGTVVAVTHDRYFLDNVAGWILELDRGRGIPFEGNYTDWLEGREKRLRQEKKQEEAVARTIRSELEWVRSNPKGRQTRNKARLQRFNELNSQEFQERNETNEIYIPPGERLGNSVIEVDNISKSFGDQVLFENLSVTIPPGAIVGIIGGNGAGKSTFFRIIAGQQTADSGTVHMGSTVSLSYVDQSRDDLEGQHTVWEEISGGLDVIRVGNYETPSRSYVGRFNFKGPDQQKYVGDLSGGERNRLHLAKTLKQGGNVLLLDEPTNDLDVETLRALEEAVLAFPGCALVISHDRWFLNRIATHIMAFEGDSSVVFLEGTYDDYAADRRRRMSGGDVDPDQPQRVRHKKLA